MKISAKGRNIPKIETSSLPDIVFILLFFFMLSTSLKEDEPLIEYTKPKLNAPDIIENKSLVDHIYIGYLGSKEVMQLNDGLAQLEDIAPWVKDNVNGRPEPDKSKIIRALHIDSQIKMDLVTKVKTELRKANALKILYATEDQSK